MHETRTDFAPDTLLEKAKVIQVGRIENSESKLNVSVREEASGNDRLVSHGYNAPTGNSTNERGNSETNSRGTEKHSNSATKSGKSSYANILRYHETESGRRIKSFARGRLHETP